MSDEEYPYIRRWGQSLGSFQYYIDDEIDRARHDGAPQNAIYRDADGTWVTADSITDPETRNNLGLPWPVSQQ